MTVPKSDVDAAAVQPRVEADGRKREIQLIAAELFKARGFDGVSVRDIAQAAGITVPTLYWYIGNKQQLLVELLESVYADSLERYETVASLDAPADEKLRAFLHTGFDLVSSRLTEVAVLVNERQVLDPERRGRLLPMRREIDATLRSILEAGAREGLWGSPSIESTRLAVWSLINYAAWWFQPDGPKTARQLADDFADIVLSGIRRTAPLD